ncbi:MAG: Maf family protein [bacterium]
MDKVILASNSPRRRQLLEMLGIDFEVILGNVEEKIDPTLAGDELVMDLAMQKAVDVFKNHKNRIVLGFDTMVYIDNEPLGKPKSAEDASRMLRLLSGRTHVVVTGCAIVTKRISKTFFERAEVTFYPLSETEIADYIASGEPFDKAGAYAVQGLGAKYVKTINGDFYTVMGLPVARLYHELEQIGTGASI